MRTLGTLVVLGFVLLGIYLSAYLIDNARYRSTDLIGCNEEQELTISRSSWPVLTEYDFTNGLEVYVGGWLKGGNLTVSGELFAMGNAKRFAANGGLVEVSRARIGEWYSDSFTLKFTPEFGATCAVRVIYKFRGI